MAPETANGEHDLHTRVVRGLGWKAFSQIAVQGMALVTTIFIAHLLTPAEVGLVAMAAVFSNLALVFVDLGLDAALIQRETLTEEDRSTAFWVNVTVGVVLTVLGIALAGPIASLYGQPEVEPLLRVISLLFIITTLGIAQGALLIRDMKFRSLEIRTVIASAVASAVAIALALLGANSWAIVGQYLTIASVSTLLLWRVSDWRPRFVFSRRSLRDLVGFSGFVVGSRFLYYLNRNVDNYLVGRYVGSAALGAYSIAYNVMLVPLTRLASPVQEVFFPALSRIREPVRVGAAWLRTTRMVAVITLPAFAGMAIVAPDFVRVVLGDQWLDAIPVLRVLCWVGILQSISWQTASVLQALGKTSWLFRCSVIATVVTVGAFVIGVNWGIVGVAWAYAIATALVTPYYLAMPLRLTGTSPLEFLRALWGVIQATVVMAVALLGFVALVPELVSPAVHLVILVALGVAVYIPTAAWRCPEAVDEVREAWRRRQQLRQAPGSGAPELEPPGRLD